MDMDLGMSFGLGINTRAGFTFWSICLSQKVGRMWGGNGVMATLEHCGDYTITQAGRGENQSMNNQQEIQ